MFKNLVMQNREEWRGQKLEIKLCTHMNKACMFILPFQVPRGCEFDLDRPTPLSVLTIDNMPLRKVVGVW